MGINMQPLLASQSLLLRPLAIDDYSPLFEIASDPAVWEQHPSKNRTEEAVFRRWFDDAIASGGALVAVDPATDEVIGTSRFAVHQPAELEIGWTFLSPSRWGGTWNREMKRLMLEHAFREVQWVRFTVHSDNVRSQRAVSRLGAVQIATEPDAEGRGVNLVYRLSRGSSPAGT